MLQGIVEHFGGKLGVLGYPMHGKPSLITTTQAGASNGGVFSGLPSEFVVARYHSLFALPEHMPACLAVTATTVVQPASADQQNANADSVIMGVRHKSLPIAAVQFHPESILTNPAYGLGMMANVLNALCPAKRG